MTNNTKLDMILKNQVAIMRELQYQAMRDPHDSFNRQENLAERINATARVVGL